MRIEDDAGKFAAPGGGKADHRIRLPPPGDLVSLSSCICLMMSMTSVISVPNMQRLETCHV